MAKLPFPIRNMARYAFGQIWAKKIEVPDEKNPGKTRMEKVGVYYYDTVVEGQFGDMLNALIPAQAKRVLDGISGLQIDLQTGQITVPTALKSVPRDSEP